MYLFRSQFEDTAYAIRLEIFKFDQQDRDKRFIRTRDCEKIECLRKEASNFCGT